MTVRFSVSPDFSEDRGNVGTKFKRLYAVQGARCYLCREPFTRRNMPSEDHVRPKSKMARGRPKRPGNILLACGPCNWGKGDREPHPCEVIFLTSIYLRMPGVDRGPRWMKANRFIPLRARLAAQAVE